MNRLELCRCKWGNTIHAIGNGREGTVQSVEGDTIYVRWKKDSGKHTATQKVDYRHVETPRQRKIRLDRMYGEYSAEVRRFSIALDLPPQTVQTILKQEGRE